MAEWAGLAGLRRLHDRRRLWAALAVVAALIIVIGSLTPGNEMPRQLPWDKLNHFIGYAGLAGLLGLAGVRLPLTLLLVVGFGGIIEFAQLLVPGRSGGDWADILANGLGAATAVLLLAVLRWLLSIARPD
ncbi:VanZ family protein [Halomonas sp. KAO]|uniref:VanZ family protein n=1 Tax=unclassified Halomonas TaxID=2609666 RepID=UPI00189D66F7|nr:MULTISPECIES: VanZ family protein [unclassified Halomonas]MBF7054752.1 VanZ family protein [Halomonas sp. KAO]MDT0500122.1 VanZ family protein [Halomonas sp. PAR7]MDT0512526.1 VanZ family protein [Halomonas sp. LES1]MDT0591160.1 VanZ family protein [Halomonas sp. PAR8]